MTHGGELRRRSGGKPRLELTCSFEELHGTFVLARGLERIEGTEISPLAGFGVLLARIKAVFAGFEFADHLANLRLSVFGIPSPFRIAACANSRALRIE